MNLYESINTNLKESGVPSDLIDLVFKKLSINRLPVEHVTDTPEGLLLITFDTPVNKLPDGRVTNIVDDCARQLGVFIKEIPSDNEFNITYKID